MCVINLGKRIKKPVTAWKVFRKVHGRLIGLQNFHYKINKLHHTNPSPGFQAFVHREDAEYAITQQWLAGSVVRKVILYGAAQGIINNMCTELNNRAGWTAPKIRIPSLRKKR